jgi:hypothetical protein
MFFLIISLLIFSAKSKKNRNSMNFPYSNFLLNLFSPNYFHQILHYFSIPKKNFIKLYFVKTHHYSKMKSRPTFNKKNNK